jgi:hypothetical protein
MLGLMLMHGDGCDVVITRWHFEVYFGSARNLYDTELARPVVSHLLDWAGISGPLAQAPVLLGPRDVAEFVLEEGRRGFSFGRHVAWIDLRGRQLWIHLRALADSTFTSIPSSRPVPRAPEWAGFCAQEERQRSTTG